MTFSRSAKLLLGLNKAEVKDMQPTDLTKRMYTKLQTSENGDPNCDLKLMYYKSNSMSVTDIYGIVDEAEAGGYEVIAIVADYLKLFKGRIGSKEKELRIIMSDVSRDLADLGLEKDLAVVSAFQLNRNAITSEKLNASHIGEAFSILDHCDYGAFIRKFYDPTSGGTFLQLFEGKQRSNEESFGTVEDYVLIPFDKLNNFRLLPTKFEENPFKGITLGAPNIPSAPSSPTPSGSPFQSAPQQTAPVSELPNATFPQSSGSIFNSGVNEN